MSANIPVLQLRTFKALRKVSFALNYGMSERRCFREFSGLIFEYLPVEWYRCNEKFGFPEGAD